MCVLSIKVPIQKKVWKLINDPRIHACIYIYIQFPVHIIQTEKRPDIVAWSDSKKSVLPRELTVPWEKPRRNTRAEEKPMRDAAYRLRGKVLDMPCDSC